MYICCFARARSRKYKYIFLSVFSSRYTNIGRRKQTRANAKRILVQIFKNVIQTDFYLLGFLLLMRAVRVKPLVTFSLKSRLLRTRA